MGTEDGESGLQEESCRDALSGAGCAWHEPLAVLSPHFTTEMNTEKGTKRWREGRGG